MGKHSTHPMNKVWAFRRTPHSLDMCVFSNIARKMNNVCIFSHDQVTHDITAVHCSLSAIWADTGIHLIVKITAQSVRNVHV